MFLKIRVKSDLEVLTGLHIGGNSAFAAIGAIDSPVIKDSVTMEPIIPGSSLKGKIRYLLSKKYNTKLTKNHSEDEECILKLFGKANSGNDKAIPCRLLFSDIYPTNENELKNKGVQSLTEAKYENTIDRLTARANPRQIERVIKGTKFDFSVVYTISGDENIKTNEVKADLELFYDGIKLLEDDYLGGSGTRGYGRVKFDNFETKVLSYKDIDKNEVEKIIQDIFKVNDEV